MRTTATVLAVISVFFLSCASHDNAVRDLQPIQVYGLAPVIIGSSGWELELLFKSGKGVYCLRRIGDKECIEIRSGISESDVTNGELRASRWLAFSDNGKSAIITESIGESSPYSVYILIQNLDSKQPVFEYVKFPPRQFNKHSVGFEYPIPVKLESNQTVVALYPVDQKLLTSSISKLVSINFDEIAGNMTYPAN